VSLYNNQYLTTLDVVPNWTGRVAGCVPGSTSAAYGSATIQMVNYFRTMAGLPSVTLDTTRTARQQSAALMMKAQDDLSHTPPPSWACYTADGAAGAGESNLALGAAGAAAVNGYMDDDAVPSLGHRRWILYPPETEMATGSTDSSNALTVLGGWGPAPPTPEYVSWPPAGFVPYTVVFNAWSFSYVGADFTNTTISMTSQGAPVNLTVVHLDPGSGDNAISWRPQGLPGGGLPDRTYTVNLNNVLVNGTPRNFTYDVTVIDPFLPPPFTCTPRPRPTMSVVRTGAG
jgi:uncharacterized protein YkwD